MQTPEPPKAHRKLSFRSFFLVDTNQTTSAVKQPAISLRVSSRPQCWHIIYHELTTIHSGLPIWPQSEFKPQTTAEAAIPPPDKHPLNTNRSNLLTPPSVRGSIIIRLSISCPSSRPCHYIMELTSDLGRVAEPLCDVLFTCGGRYDWW